MNKLLLIILALGLGAGSARAQLLTGQPTAAFPDSEASRLVKQAPYVFLGRPLQSELYYNEATQKSYVSTAVQVLHVLRGDSLQLGPVEFTAETPTVHTGVGPAHLFGNRKYVYNQDVFLYFGAPSRLPRNPAPFATTNKARVMPAPVGPGLSPTVHFMLSGNAEPARIYGLGREFNTCASLYQHLSSLAKLNLPDPKFSKYQRPFSYQDGRPDWIGVPTSPSSSLADPLTVEEIIQARNTIESAPFVFTGMVINSTRFEDAEGKGYISEVVQPVWIFRSGGVLTKDPIEVVEPEETYEKALRGNVPVVYFAEKSQLPSNPQIRAQVNTMPALRVYKGDAQAKVMIGKVGTVLGYNGLYQSFASPQESWGYINQLPDITPWLPAPASSTSRPTAQKN